MKWSSSSNSSLSSSGAAGMASANSNNSNNSSCNTSSNSNSSQNGGGCVVRAIGVRRHASDRRSIFYTDPDDMEIFAKNHSNKKMSPSLTTREPITIPTNASATTTNMTTPVPSSNVHLRLQAAGEAVEMQQRKCENLISYFTTQIHRLNKELENEKRWRDTHLAKIVKALLCFEAKLKTDQKQIRQQLYEKDTELNRLARQVIALREKYGEKNGDDIQIDSIAQYCPNCRKQYYFLDTRDVGVQMTKHELSCGNGVERGNVIAATTSSEDGLGHVFSEARRSKRYMSKRTSGTFREYLKTRSIDLPADTNENSGFNNNEERSQPQTENSVRPKESFTRKGSMRRSTKSAVQVKCDRHNSARDRSGAKYDSNLKSANESNGVMCDSNANKMKNGETSNSSFLKKYDDEVGTPKTQFESTDDWYASASDMDDSDSAVSKPYGYNAVNPVLECVNQILLQQSMDGIMDNCTNSNEKTASNTNANAISTATSNNNSNDQSSKETNTLKKRVHFSTQNSMVQVPRSDSSTSGIYQLTTSTISTADTCTNLQNQTTLSYATIYSNDYEPIGSENNSTNHYVDMESKLEDDRPVMMEKSKTPPALPPKPPNLMKFRQTMKMPMTMFPIQSTAKQMDNESEPDYCSISDVQEAIIKNVQIVADVHKAAEDDVSSHASEETKTDVTDETFADVPKLPNVAAILSPKKEPIVGKLISQDNYITKSSPSPPRAKPAILPTKAAVANLLQELNAQKNKNSIKNAIHKNKITNELEENGNNNKKLAIKLITQQKMTTIVEQTSMTSSSSSQPQQSTTILPMQPKTLPLIKPNDKMLMPIQAEFDWYNLDVEYGKLMPTNLLENGKDEFSGIDTKSDAHNKNFGVEYNLDAEFSLTSCSLSSDNNSSIESSGSTIHFLPIAVAEDGNSTTEEDMSTKRNAQKLYQSHHKKYNHKSTNAVGTDVNGKSFDTFLEQTGLTTKPLPQKRKIFYNAPFV